MKFLRTVSVNLANLLALVAVLVGGLFVWSQLHTDLRLLGPDSVVFLSVFALLSVPIFLAVGRWARTGPFSGSRLRQHFTRVGVLYAYTAVALGMMVAFPSEGIALEGGDIGLRASVFVALLGIIIDAFADKRMIALGR